MFPSGFFISKPIFRSPPRKTYNQNKLFESMLLICKILIVNYFLVTHFLLILVTDPKSRKMIQRIQ